MFYLALFFAKLAQVLISILAPGRGTDFPGLIAFKLDSNFLKHIKGIDLQKTVIITGTNGKSLTTNLIAHILKENKFKFCANLRGANLRSGIAAALLSSLNIWGRYTKEYLVLEVDERSLGLVREQLPAKHLLITNIQKDQVQRNAEPALILAKIKAALDADCTLYLNNDEARSSSIRQGKRVYCGLARHESFQEASLDPSLGQACPLCFHPLQFSYRTAPSMGKFACTNCHYQAQEQPDYLLEIAKSKKQASIQGVNFPLASSKVFMWYNYCFALAVSEQVFGLAPKQAAESFASFQMGTKRFADLSLAKKKLVYMQVKAENPDNLANSIQLISQDPEDKAVFLIFENIEEFNPYINTSWQYDAGLETLVDPRIKAFVCLADSAVIELKAALVLSGIDPEIITTIDGPRNIPRIIAEIEKLDVSKVYLICTWEYQEPWTQELIKECSHVR